MGQVSSIVQMMKTLRQISEGLKNSVFKKEHVEQIAEARMKVCEECPHIDLEGSTCMVPGTQPCCGICGCKLSLKVRCLSCECPDEEFSRWSSVMTQEKEDELKEELGYSEEE